MEVLYADMDVGQLKYGGWSLKELTLRRYYQVGQKQRGTRTHRPRDGGIMVSKLDNGISINLMNYEQASASAGHRCSSARNCGLL
jgi:hypothetical protein